MSNKHEWITPEFEVGTESALWADDADTTVRNGFLAGSVLP